MILTGAEIIHQHALGAIVISDFEIASVSPNSYDLTLASPLLRYSESRTDARCAGPADYIEIPAAGYKTEAGEFLLATCRESIGSDVFVPILHGRSGLARVGLFPHITADLLQLGFRGRPTLQLYSVLPLVLYEAMPIAQVSFWQVFGEVTLYNGEHQGSMYPRVAVGMLKDER